MTPGFQVTTRSYFRTLKILHLALAAGQVIFLLICVLLQLSGREGQPFPDHIQQLLYYITAGFAAAGLTGSWGLFQAKLRPLRNTAGMKERFTGYRSALLIRYAILEAPSLMSLVLFLLTGDYIFMGIALVLIAVFVLIRPAPSGMIQHLQLPYEEKLLLEDPEALLYEENITGAGQ